LIGWLRSGGGIADTLAEVMRELRERPPEACLALAASVLAEGFPAAAAALLESALPLWPEEIRIQYTLGAALRAAGALARAEAAFREVLARQPGHEYATLSLALCLRDGGRLNAAAMLAAELPPGTVPPPEDLLRRIELLFHCRAYAQVAPLCRQALAAGYPPALHHLHAGRAAHALGRFADARGHFLASLDSGLDLANWGGIFLYLAGSQPYADADHPDLRRFRRLVADPATPVHARCAAAFALGKACDDLGDVDAAAHAYRSANAWVAAQRPWPRDAWRAWVQQRLDVVPAAAPRRATADATPVFVVGLPRTGTTFLAELLGRHPAVRNRGETEWIPYIARELAARADSGHEAVLCQAGALYRLQMRQDDAPAACYIDKNPLNFRHLELIAQILPEARVIHCVRAPGDAALSIWSQFFEHRDCNFAYDFESIEAFMQGERALMRHFGRHRVLPIHTVEYERLVEQPFAVLAEVSAFLELLPAAPRAAAADGPIATVSAWQARQPVHRSSVGRWLRYLPQVPELRCLAGDAARANPSADIPGAAQGAPAGSPLRQTMAGN
jgi:tetratricopeptide (TPR) repeat protein